MIEIIPSIAVLGGKCVRIGQGDASQKKVYNEPPLEVAKRFEDHGIKKIHLIDLDGAEKGEVVNFEVLQMIAGYTGLSINFGGGIYTDGDATKAFEYGAQLITVGSLAVSDKELFSSWIISYSPKKLVLSADALEGEIMTRAWHKKAGIPLEEHIAYYADRGIRYVKCSDIKRDGQMAGPNFGLYQALKEKFPEQKLIASGGISSIEDIKKLEVIGIEAVIVGKAIYEGNITLNEIDGFLADTR